MKSPFYLTKLREVHEMKNQPTNLKALIAINDNTIPNDILARFLLESPGPKARVLADKRKIFASYSTQEVEAENLSLILLTFTNGQE